MELVIGILLAYLQTEPQASKYRVLKFNTTNATLNAAPSQMTGTNSLQPQYV